MRTILIALALVTAMLATACGGDDANPTSTEGKSDVHVTLQEYEVSTDTNSIPAGQVVFAIDNTGKETHELKIVQTDLKPEALPTKADGSVDEAALGTAIAGKAEAIQAGQSQSLSTKLKAGNYVLISNTVSNLGGQAQSDYGKGMHLAFTVK